MKSTRSFDKVMPGEILILYKEDDSYVYAKNDGNGLIIERAFVPVTQVKRTHNPPLDLEDSRDVWHELELYINAKDIGDKLRSRKKEDKETNHESAFIHMLFSVV